MASNNDTCAGARASLWDSCEIIILFLYNNEEKYLFFFMGFQ